MVVVGDNLKGLIQAKNICDENLFDEFSIKITLGRTVFRLKPKEGDIIKYGRQTVNEYYTKDELKGELVLVSGECVLACSAQDIKMPLVYIGFLFKLKELWLDCSLPLIVLTPKSNQGFLGR